VVDGAGFLLDELGRRLATATHVHHPRPARTDPPRLRRPRDAAPRLRPQPERARRRRRASAT
jgi:hypothetical protein